LAFVTKLINNEIEHLGRRDTINILDIGAGPNLIWAKIVGSIINSKNINITLFDSNADLINLKALKGANVKIIEGTAPYALNQFENNEFDLIICFNLIEHLTKSDGYLLLYEINRISTGSAIIYTPNGFQWQPPSQNAPLNAHISDWDIKDFKKFQYFNRKGHVGFKKLFGPYAQPLYHFRILYRISGFCYPLIQLIPRLCFAISYVKRTKQTYQDII
jgi:hypothetical protein